MLSSAIPTRQDIIWASSAGGTYVRTVPDTTGDANAASFTLGFPPNTFVQPGSGGEPPDGRDFNGAFQAMSAWCQWIAAGGPVFYNSSFQTAIGGYPKFAILPDSTTVGLYWISNIENNTNTLTAGSGGTGWQQFPPAAAANVSSFNTRTGAVTLTSSDVTTALSANAMPFAKIATVAALSLLGNTGGSAATAAPVSISSVLGLLGLTGNLAVPGHVAIPLDISGSVQNFIINWGSATSGIPGSSAVTFDMTFPNSVFVAVCTANGTPPSTIQNLTRSGMTVFAGGNATAVGWIALGM